MSYFLEVIDFVPELLSYSVSSRI